MIDFYLTKFYNCVKDYSWPNIETLADINNLPEYMRHELKENFNLSNRLNEIENLDYWRAFNRQTSLGFKKDSLMFVPVLKCASTFFVNVFTQQLQGWEPVNIYDQDWNHITAFGTIMHPLKRRIKGLTNNLMTSYNTFDDLIDKLNNDAGLRKFITHVSVGDMHTMPYNIMYGPYLSKINWIPMDVGQDCIIKLLNQKFNEHGITDRIVFDPMLPANRSADEKLEVYNKLVNLYFNCESNEMDAMFLYTEDLKFYHQLLKEYNL